MTIKTFIKGKDSSLEDSILKMKNLLQVAGFEIEEASWLNPVANVYSVHIRDKNCPALFTNGKGACEKSCLASAYGEFFERLASNYFFSDFFMEESATDFLYYPNEKNLDLAEYKSCLTPELWQLYDVDNELQAEDFLSLNDAKQQITCLPMDDAFTQQQVYFPVNIFSNLYASNGLCAGNTFLEAKVQGLSEVFERWVKGKILKENICLPEVPNNILESYPNLETIIEDLKKHGLDVSVRDASLGGKYPVISVILFEQKTGQCFASFGAHPIFEVAVERTLTESLQGRKLGELDGFQTPVFDADLVADDENIENHFIDSSGLIHAKFISQSYDYEFSEWDFSGDTQAQYDYLLSIFKQLGASVYIADYQHFELPVSRVVVPGLSEVFPISELIDNNQNQGRVLREILQAFSEQLDAEQTLEEIEQLGLTDHQGVANLIGLLPDADSYWKKFKVIELKMFLQLANQNYEEAYETLQDSFYFVDDQTIRTFYKALSMSLEIILYEDQTVYNKKMLNKLFGKLVIDKVNESIAGECLFYGLPIGNQAFETSKMHQKLKRAYNIAQEYKNN
jgi:ribosomal protein S12 methylthiotransferase accessory factor